VRPQVLTGVLLQNRLSLIQNHARKLETLEKYKKGDDFDTNNTEMFLCVFN